MISMLTRAKAAKTAIAALTTEQKNAALAAMADALIANQEAILAANKLDLDNAPSTISPVMIDRLALSPARIEGMAQGIREVAALPDPVGRTLGETRHKNGMTIRKVSVPFGVVGVIYEARPNVTADVFSLCFRSSACFWASW